MEQSPPRFIAGIPAGVNYFNGTSRQVPVKVYQVDKLISLCNGQSEHHRVRLKMPTQPKPVVGIGKSDPAELVFKTVNMPDDLG
jgi:hypothetical protein